MSSAKGVARNLVCYLCLALLFLGHAAKADDATTEAPQTLEGETEAQASPSTTPSEKPPTEQPSTEEPSTVTSTTRVAVDSPKSPGHSCGAPCNESFPVPVCGSNGRVYNSECALVNANCRQLLRRRSSKRLTPAHVVDWERCRGRHPLCPDKCLDIYDPVCGKDGKLYPNLCIMQRRNCGKVVGTQTLAICIASAREARKLDSCPSDCSELYEPVCGSNGEVYLNECFFKKETCGSKERVVLVPLSRCLERPKCPKRCLPILDPVCGSDGNRYLNHCRMQQRNCGSHIVVMPKSFCS